MPHKPQADCRLVDFELMGSNRRPAGAPLSEAARRHFEECSRCRTLYAWISTSPALAGPSSGLQQRILSDLTASLKPVTPLPAVPVLVAGFVLVFLALAAALIAMTDKAGFRTMTTPQLVFVTVALLSGATLACMVLVWQMIPGSFRPISARMAAGIPAFVLILGLGLLFPWRSTPAFFSEGWPCTLMGLGIAAGAAALFLPIIRRGAATSRTAAGAALGGFAGMLAVTVLQFQCMRQQAPHLLVWHLGSLALAIFLGALIGWIVPSPRRSA